jgi:hypothetical protein
MFDFAPLLSSPSIVPPIIKTGTVVVVIDIDIPIGNGNGNTACSRRRSRSRSRSDVTISSHRRRRRRRTQQHRLIMDDSFDPTFLTASVDVDFDFLLKHNRHQDDSNNYWISEGQAKEITADGVDFPCAAD